MSKIIYNLIFRHSSVQKNWNVVNSNHDGKNNPGAIIIISRKIDSVSLIFILFSVTDTIVLLEFYFALAFFSSLLSLAPALRNFPPIFVPLTILHSFVSFQRSTRVPRFSMRDDKSWISCVLETNRMKNISLHGDVSRVFSRARGSEDASPGRVLEYPMGGIAPRFPTSIRWSAGRFEKFITGFIKI